jgi:hypothetical protein
VKGAPALAAAACWLWGCGGAAPPDPRVLSIEPSTMISSGTASVVITVDAVLPFKVDYNTGTISVFRSLLANVGNVVVGNGRYENDGMLPAFIPSRLQPGLHDVTVTLSDGRVGVLAGAFTVTPGSWPASGFTIDPIANPQTAGVPFALTIRAQGAFSATFNGTVDYFVAGVSTVPSTTAPFLNGVRSETVVVVSPTRGTPTHVTATDLLGRIAVSNDFIVN